MGGGGKKRPADSEGKGERTRSNAGKPYLDRRERKERKWEKEDGRVAHRKGKLTSGKDGKSKGRNPGEKKGSLATCRLGRIRRLKKKGSQYSTYGEKGRTRGYGRQLSIIANDNEEEGIIPKVLKGKPGGRISTILTLRRKKVTQ